MLLNSVVIKNISLVDLPLFNSDLEGELIEPVNGLKESLHEFQGLIISSREYDRGISGELKKTLSWGIHAQIALREVLVTMWGRIIEDKTLSMELIGTLNYFCNEIENSHIEG